MQFLRYAAQLVARSFVAKLALALLALIGIGPERLAIILNSWWTSDPSQFVLDATRAVCLLVALVGCAIWIWPKIKWRYFPDSIRHVDHLHLAAGFDASANMPASLLAIMSTSVGRLTVLLDYNRYYTAIGSAGWTANRRVQIASLQNVIAGQQLNLPIVSGNLDGSVIWWGNANDAIGNEIQRSTRYRAAIRFVDEHHHEQLFRFGLYRTPEAGRPYVVTAFTARDLDF